MALSAQYVDGQLVSGNQSLQGSSNTASRAEKGSNEMDKDAFLQLLVAQMKYQDPLEPTSNTEYISQYATFSELEQMQNMAGNLTLSRASETVGKEVIIETKGDNGESKVVQGYVEKVVYNGSKAYLSIDGTLYSIDDLKEVIDGEYLYGANSVERIQEIIGKLPKVEALSMNEVGSVVEAYNLFNSLTEYQASLLPKDLEEILQQYVLRANELMAQALTEDKETGESSTGDPVEDNNQMIESTGDVEEV